MIAPQKRPNSRNPATNTAFVYLLYSQIFLIINLLQEQELLLLCVFKLLLQFLKGTQGLLPRIFVIGCLQFVSDDFSV